MDECVEYLDDQWFMNEDIDRYIEKERKEYYKEWGEYMSEECDDYDPMAYQPKFKFD